MVTILLDACVPHRLRQDLREFDVETAQHAGLDHLCVGDLLDAIEGRYDVLVTRDRNLRYQQTIAGRAIAVIVLRSVDQTPAAYKTLLPHLKKPASPWIDRRCSLAREGMRVRYG